MEKLEGKNLYPLLFKPIYKKVVWGGNMLKPHLNRKIPKSKIPIGEAWEIVDRKDATSIVENGPLKGYTIAELREKFGKDIISKKFNGDKFPLLIKIIDAGQRLSLQVHPDETAAQKMLCAEPKTEAWFIIAAEKGAKIIAGLNHRCTKRSFIDTCHTPEIENCLEIYQSNPGDAYFITAGTVHSIGAGNLILEIQQNSDTTYRISDWGRIGPDKKPRELNLEEAINCINFTQRPPLKITGDVSTVSHNRKAPIIKWCPYFKVDILRLVSLWTDTTTKDSFHILTAIDNPINVGNQQMIVKVDPGRSCLIPAAYGDYTIEVKEETTVIKTYL